LIRIDAVTKRFGPRVVVDGLQVAVARGEILGLLGPNGSGKTTTVRLCNGVIRPDQGRITVDGQDTVTGGEAVRAACGVLTESSGFYGHLSALENLLFFAALHHARDPGRPGMLLGEFGLEEHADKPVATFSTGMRKRLGLAKALLHRPRVLFLDEPTNGLDPEGIRLVLDHIARLSRQDGTTMVVCSHLLQQLETVCHRYVFIDQGRVVEQGTLAELEERHSDRVVLEVETDLPLEGTTYRGAVARRLGPRRLELAVRHRDDVPPLLRALAAEALVWSAAVVNQDLESLYFRIREHNRRG
jgi:ABC-2 type transport system ATP-binding protein